jgi:hypothetical protein
MQTPCQFAKLHKITMISIGYGGVERATDGAFESDGGQKSPDTAKTAGLATALPGEGKRDKAKASAGP